MAEVIKKEKKNAEEAVKKTAETVKKAEPVKKAAEEVKKSEAVEKKEAPKTVKPAEKHENATGLRIGAVILWLCAFACEIIAILVLKEKIEINLPFEPWVKLVFFLILDLIFLVIGSQLWKKANHKDPVSKKNKLKFWLWNNMGMIVAALAFIPFIILTLSDKNADAKTKKIATAAAVVALAIGLLTGHDWNPISEEQIIEAETVLAGYDIFWTSGGQRYHLDDDCSSLANSSEIYKGDVDEAVHSYGKDFLCKFCMRHHVDEIEGIENLVHGASD